MHDIADLERRGVVGVFVAAAEFVAAAAAQSRALGFDAPAVFVPHPIQDRTDAEMRALAESAVDAVWAKLTAAPTGSAQREADH